MTKYKIMPLTGVYTFTDDSWYDSGPGCDCCEGDWVELYNCKDTLDWLGSAHSIDDAFVQAIVTDLGLGEDGDYQHYYEKTQDELEEVLLTMGISVAVDGEFGVDVYGVPLPNQEIGA